MGYKLSVLALPGEWDAAKLTRLRVAGSRKLRELSLETALYPAENPCVAQWRGYTCVFWFGFYDSLVQEKADLGLEARILEAIGPSRAYYFGLVSTINLYAISAWEGGQRVRRLMGWTDEVCADEGPPLTEELAERARFRALTLDGVPHFEDKKSGERYSHDQVGENFVLAASAAVFGAPLHMSNPSLDDAKFPEYETWDAHRTRLFGE